MLQKWKQGFSEFQKKYETRLDVLFFIGGFTFDAFMVSEVDEPLAIAQQFFYLFIIAILIHYEILFRMLKWRPEGYWIKFWNYRNLLIHFLLGTLLNIYSLFYIKSSSFINSIIFLLLMSAGLLANELPFVKKSKVSIKVGLFSICLLSFFSIIYPLILGFIGWTPFALAVATTLAFFYVQIRWLQKTVLDSKVLFGALLFPGCSVLLVFSFFYWMGWVPPIPLSTKTQGVYHLIEKKDGDYLLSTEKVWWKFWQSGDQDFLSEPGDKIYFYAQIFSPARISGDVFIHWFYKDTKNSWQSADRIPLKIVGGRKEGYRGYAIKANYQPGSWRVQVETPSGQEISRLSFSVTSVEKNENRTFQVIKL